MKIGIDIRVLNDKEYSGIPIFTFELINSLASLDENLEIKLFNNSFRSKKNITFPHKNIEITNTKIPNKIFNIFSQNLVRYPKLDKILNVDTFFMPNIGFVSLSNNCKKIITIHDLSFSRYCEFYSRKKRMWHKIINVKKILRDFDQIIAVSNNTKDDLIDIYKIPEEKIKVIYSGINNKYRIINKEKHKEKIKNIMKKYDLPDNFLFSLGTIEPRKNTLSILKAFASLTDNREIPDNLNLVVAGGKGWMNSDFNKFIKKKKYKNIKFISYVDEEDKPFLFNLASIFIYTSFYEGFGFPVLESLACGTPVIASNNSSIPEICHNKCTLINPYDINSIKQAIIENIKITNIKGKNIILSHFFKQQYSWQNTAKEYFNIININ